MTGTLFVHIGTGKTGSTAIQKYMANRRGDFTKHGIYYLGINLEHSPSNHRFSWQKPTGIGILQSMSPEQAIQELNQALEEALSSIGSERIGVWSNESIYERPSVYIPLFQNLLRGGEYTVKPIAYARSTQSYVLSAYRQWGVKHKTYPGKILGFSEWVSSRLNFLSYGEKLKKWDESFADLFELVNYDYTPDVAYDFISRITQCTDLLPQPNKGKENTSPTDLQLALYALYNNQFSEPVLPTTISSLLNRYKLETRNFHVDSLSDLFPSPAELEKAETLLRDDKLLVDSILKRHNQPTLRNTDPHDLRDSIVSEQGVTSGILSLLVALMVEQERRITELEELITLERPSPPPFNTTDP